MAVDAPRKSWPPKPNSRGVVCGRCGCADLRVRNTRYSMGRIIRYRECRHCGKRLTTYEVTPSMLGNPGRDGVGGGRL